MSDLLIKPDPDAPGASPAALSEEDIYEDAGDLEFNNDDKYQRLYLARVPKYVWEAWSKLDDNEEIRIGTIRQSFETDANGVEKQTSLSMLLSSEIVEHQMVPKEYLLDVTEEHVKNTFVFTEQDLPGFKSKSKQKFDLASANMPGRLSMAKKNSEKAKTPYDPNKRFQPYYRKAIPKRTTLTGRVAHEVNCVAVENEESERLLAQRTIEAMQPKVSTMYIADQDLNDMPTGFIQPGTVAAGQKWGTFIKTSGPVAGKKSQLQKTARMPQNELLDRLFSCFSRHRYWPMKALRQELQQPEAYLRETLDRIAILHKSGPFATNWGLKPENRQENYSEIADTVAPAEDAEMDDEDDDDVDMKFEDV
ncbi:hypothetical protein HYALB_00004198 [Hymenoscyphus albidus]|uniref:Transcription initiation factor IIF subunit beta n=1 Tax=Hymenoscyphus albidus TaxID=595503 RepID=A0A9N9LZJ4_9HELO|nr:hypothetical protein HYALB_00004198 [Hymenoscyphus albidus]